MHTRITITRALGALALLATVSAQAALAPLAGYTDPEAFQARLVSLGLEIRNEGFEPTVNGVDTPWKPALTSPLLEVAVPSMGVLWFQTDPDNSGFGITTNGGDTQEGEYAMNLPGVLDAGTMSYAVKTNGFKLVAFGGWFKDNNGGSKPKFTVDDGRSVEDIPLGLNWQFLGFIDEDPNGGFTQVSVTETEGINQVEFFFTDGVTLAAQSGLFPPIPVPAALPLFGSALLGLGFVARRRKKA